MKSLDQIIRYTSHCRFPDDDWQEVLKYCREHFSGGKIHKALKPISESTFQQFQDWIERGFGSGDIVGYGHTIGVVGSSTPDKTYLAAYCDFDGKLIVKDMIVPSDKLYPLEDEKRTRFKQLLFEQHLDFSARGGNTVEMYTPQKFSYVSLGYDNADDTNVGMYSHSDDLCYYFIALYGNKKLHLDCMIEKGCTPLRPATNKEIQLLHKAASSKGYTFNSRTNQFVKRSHKGQTNAYWYISERFTVIADKDNGSSKHTDRYEAGNYFIDYTEAIMFAKEIIKLRKGEQ